MNSDIATGSFAVGGAPVSPLYGVQAPAARAPTVPVLGSRPAVRHEAAVDDVLQRAARRVVEAMQEGGVSFKFTIDKQSGMTIVRIFNKATGELVRQIPSEEAVHVAALLRQDEQRSLLDLRV